MLLHQKTRVVVFSTSAKHLKKIASAVTCLKSEIILDAKTKISYMTTSLYETRHAKKALDVVAV